MNYYLYDIFLLNIPTNLHEPSFLHLQTEFVFMCIILNKLWMAPELIRDCKILVKERGLGMPAHLPSFSIRCCTNVNSMDEMGFQLRKLSQE